MPVRTKNMSNFKYIRPSSGGLEKTVTTGPTMTWEAWCRLVAALEAKAELAKQNGLPATAKSWRSTIENLRPAISFSARALHKSITKHRFPNQNDGSAHASGTEILVDRRPK